MAAVISPIAGTRIEPMDSYSFVRGTTVTFKQIFTNNGVPTTLDTGMPVLAVILMPLFLSNTDAPTPTVIASLAGTLTPGQQFEYSFSWDIPLNLTPLNEYIVSYQGYLGGTSLNFGDEFFSIKLQADQIGIQAPSYATVADVRAKKFNIDDYLPQSVKADLVARNNLITGHLTDATKRLREELNLSKSRSNSENYRLFCIYYTIWSLMLAARGEDGSAVSDQNILFWRTEWERILAQEKRESVMQGMPMGRG
jgi:hypothetical protein